MSHPRAGMMLARGHDVSRPLGENMPARGASAQARGWGWRHAGREAWAVRGLELRIAPGERVLLLGASGSGKSTLLRGLAGVLGDDEDGDAEGALEIDGVPAAAARGRAGLVQQDPETQVVLARVGDDVAFGCENLGVPRDEIWRRVPEALRAVGLELPLDHSTAALSGGQKQRLALAGALAMRPGLLLLDEPTAQLDPDGVREVRDAVLRAVEASGSTLVVVEHRVDAWAPHMDRVVVIGAGGVLADGRPDEVFAAHAEGLEAAGVWLPTPDPASNPVAQRSGEAAETKRPAPTGSEPAEEAVLLVARDLAVARPGSVPAASGIHLDVRAGRALAITGPNGAGKSTLALTIAGLLTPASPEPDAAPVRRSVGPVVGSPRAESHQAAPSAHLRTTDPTTASPDPTSGRQDPSTDGAPAAHPRSRTDLPSLSSTAPRPLAATDELVGALAERTRPWRRRRRTDAPSEWTSRELLTRIGMVFQSPEHQLLARTVRAELEVGPRALRLGEDEIRARVEPLLDRLRLRHLADANPFTLSGGEKRRLTVAAALATRPRVLVLDEPTFGQDARTWRELVALLAELRDAGTALVVVTHDEPLVAALADDVLRLDPRAGGLLASGRDVSRPLGSKMPARGEEAGA